MNDDQAIDEFYATQPVVTSPDQLKPGVKVTGFFACDGPEDGVKMEILSEPEPYNKFSSAFRGRLVVDVRQRCGGTWVVGCQLLEDFGIMPEGRQPYNKDRLVLGWPS
ncbi:MAG: hypothetical protein PHU86_00620 [Patescibacteria group bacterium]|nr:hypothetical protein [Patescibacteria group bacterium]